MVPIGLLRHGEVEGGSCFRGSTDDPLTHIGLEQMKQAIQGGYHWDQVITSPLQRCTAFAKEYALQHGLSLHTEKRFAEIHFGAWEGRSAADIMATEGDALEKFWENPVQYTPPKAEPLMDFASRVLDAWQDLFRRWGQQRVLLVTHGGVIRILLCHIHQYPIAKLLEFEVKHGGLFIISTSIKQPTPFSKPIEQFKIEST